MTTLTLKDDTVSHCFTFFLYVADPATLLALNSVQGTLLSLWEQLLHSVMEKKYFLVSVITL